MKLNLGGIASASSLGILAGIHYNKAIRSAMTGKGMLIFDDVSFSTHHVKAKDLKKELEKPDKCIIKWNKDGSMKE